MGRRAIAGRKKNWRNEKKRAKIAWTGRSF